MDRLKKRIQTNGESTEYKVFNPDCSIARVSDSLKSISREESSLSDIFSTDINTSL
jgi:hypothetical protein